MQIKEFLAMVLLFTMIFIGVACMSATVHGADVNIQRDFDNVTIYHAEKSDSSSQAVYGLENNAKLIGRDRVNHTEPVSTMKNTVVESDTGYYTYSHLIDEDGNQLNPTDRVKFNYNRTLTAIYGFTPYMNAEIDVIDLHGHSASSVTYPAMKYETDSVTKTFKPFTDVETGYSPLYILDLDTNVKYQPGDKFTITYNDVANTGLTRMIKTFQYVYAKDIVIENIIVENRTVYNDTVVDRTIYNDTIIDRTIYNDTIINRTIENITYVDKIIEVPVYVNKTIENITYVNKTIEVPIYVDKVIENVTYVNKTIDVPFYKIIVIPEIIIDNATIPIVNNNNTDQYNETNTIEVPNNNTTNTNNITSNINKENNTGTSTSDNIKTVTMEKTGNTFGLILVIIHFIILIQLYRREDD